MSTVNPYFPKGVASEQAIYQALTTESIKIQGHEVYYIPRKNQKLDLIFGEDVLSKFDTAVPIEMYMTKPGWQGQTDLIQKFGLYVQESVSFIISKPRWLETVPVTCPWLANNGVRPLEGDLIWEPIAKNLYEITYVDVESVYYQLNKTYQFKIDCKLFVYSSEQLDTGISDVDNLEEIFSNDLLKTQLLDENGEPLLQETTDALSYTDPALNGDFAKNKEIDTEYVENGAFNIKDPFGEMQ
jgi:hypothetical protein